MSLKDLLSASRSKSSLTSMFAQGLLDHFSNDNTFKLVVVFDTKIKVRTLKDIIHMKRLIH